MCFNCFLHIAVFASKVASVCKRVPKWPTQRPKMSQKRVKKQTQNHNTHRIRKNTKFSSKKVPQMGLFGAPGAPPGPPRTGQRAPGRPPGARMGTRRAHGYQNGPKKAPKWTQNGPQIDPHKGTVGEFTEKNSSRQRPIRNLQVTERVGGMRGAIE